MTRLTALTLLVLVWCLPVLAHDRAAQVRSAAATGDLQAIEIAIRDRIALDQPDGSGQTALLLAVAGGHDAAALALIDGGASINAVAGNKDTPWLLAGALGRATVLQRMLAAGPDLGLRNRYGGNALIPACERGHVEAIAVLLASKIDVDHVNDLGWTCLLEIVILGDGSPRHREAARLVLEAGANPNLADRDRVSPLTHAKRRGFVEIARSIESGGGR